jgi:uncharacterized surface protein with fasciclin (FAS1) repeats
MFYLLFVFLTLFLTQHVVSGQNLTLREIIDSDSDFSTLGQALDAATIDLGALEAVYTLFAPTNDAFSALDSAFLERLLSPGWINHLIVVLAMHLLVDAIPAASLVDGDYVAVNGETLTIVTVGDSVQISSPSTFGALSKLPETVASNGFLYKMDAVLLPSFASMTILDIATSEDFSILYELLALTGLNAVLSGGDITATVFAPTDDAFNALGPAALDYYRANVDIANVLLLGHLVINEVVPSSEAALGPTELLSAAGEPLIFQSVTLNNGAQVYIVNEVEMLLTDVLANNGIVHVLNGVIAVPGTEVPTTPTPSPAPFVSPVDFPTASPVPTPNGGGMGKMKKKGMDMESKGMMDKISKGGMDKESKGMDKESKGMGGDGASKGMGGDGASKGMGGASKGGDGVSKGMGGDDTSKGMSKNGESKGMGMSSE